MGTLEDSEVGVVKLLVFPVMWSALLCIEALCYGLTTAQKTWRLNV